MEAPKDKHIIKGEIADYWMEDGILYSLSKSPKRTVENISANVALVKEITGNKPMPLLIYLANSPVPERKNWLLYLIQLLVIYWGRMKIISFKKPEDLDAKSFYMLDQWGDRLATPTTLKETLYAWTIMC